MKNAEWVIIDTETTGLGAPVFVVELAAQRMRGWQSEGAPFRYLLNHGMEIPPDASRIHGYTREILARDGESPLAVYRGFARYLENRPVAAYNLAYDWDEVLLPEWQRLGLAPVGTRGFCMMQLAQRLLDPVPAGNCKLQTLRQYYNLPERGGHTALGDVETVIDLGQKVLRPLAEARGLSNWQALVTYSEATWFPARIPFGKFKGRLFREACHDERLHGWLEWLAASSNPRSAQMGSWYLAQLDAGVEGGGTDARLGFGGGSTTTPVDFKDPEIDRLKLLIDDARTQLAELEAAFTREHHAASSTQAELFELLRPLFQKRDQLKLRLDYRHKYLDVLLYSGEEDAATVEKELDRARAQIDAEYERAARTYAKRGALNCEEEAELKGLWRKLVKLFLPDRFMDDNDKQDTYQKLTMEINRARDLGDIKRIREIADDPQSFISRQGWSSIDLDDFEQLDKLKHLYELLKGQTIALLETLNTLRQTGEYELHELFSAQRDSLAQVAREQSQAVEEEIKTLESELEHIERELERLQA